MADPPPTVRVAVQGCCHGDLDAIYATALALGASTGRPIDLLLICGDFQAVRNADDLECLACPPKHRALKDFPAYHAGVKKAPIPTIFIGGNHEASNYLAELPYGGFVAPNIFYLGHAGCVTFDGLRIAGLSGIYNARHYECGRFEAPPYSQDTLRSTYHVRSIDVHRLACLTGPIDAFLSHDWPAGIARHGDTAALLARKSFLRSEVADGSLGSPPAAALLAVLRPAHWFAAHLHVKFAALVAHPADGAAGGFAATRFLALDKCLPGRPFLQVLDLTPSSPPAAPRGALAYDPQWLAILTATHALASRAVRAPPLPPAAAPDAAAVAAAAARVGGGSLAIPQNFAPTAPAPPPGDDTRGRHARGRMPAAVARNPQTVALLGALGLDFNFVETAADADRGGRPVPPPPPPARPPASAADAIFEAAARAAAVGARGGGSAAAATADEKEAEGGDAAPPAVADPNAIDLDDV